MEQQSQNILTVLFTLIFDCIEASMALSLVSMHQIDMLIAEK